METLILQRHGARFIKTGERSGDGPLTPQGYQDALQNALNLKDDLIDLGIKKIDLAVVSSAVRCTQTFAAIWGVLHEHRIVIKKCETSKEFFSAPHEDVEWARMYRKHGKALRQDIEKYGEKEAVLKYADRLVVPCAMRTSVRIASAFQTGANTVLAVTHAPHDALIQERFTGKEPRHCLELGAYRIIEVTR